MRPSLTLKLTLGFAAVGLVVVALVAVLARITTVQAFDQLRVDQARSAFVSAAAKYFREHGSWAGAAAALRPPLPEPGEPEKSELYITPADWAIVLEDGILQQSQRKRRA